jgi:hypothetical protein
MGLPRHNNPIIAVSTSPCGTSGRFRSPNRISLNRLRSGDCWGKAPAKARPECETRISSVCVMANSIGSIPSPCGCIVVACHHRRNPLENKPILAVTRKTSSRNQVSTYLGRLLDVLYRGDSVLPQHADRRCSFHHRAFWRACYSGNDGSRFPRGMPTYGLNASINISIATVPGGHQSGF